MNIDPKSMAKLSGVHPDLVKVVKRAAELSTVPFVITCGLRTLEEQKRLVAKGASKTLKSRHLTGHAVDLAAYFDDGDGNPWDSVRWDWPLYHKLADAMKAAAKELKVTIEWGGDWRTFKDGPHFQLSHRLYK